MQTEEKTSTELAINSPQITPMMLIEKAIEKGMDIDKLEKLMDLQERWEQNEAKKAFYDAMSKFKKDAPQIIKNKNVSYATKEGRVVSYSHANLAEVVEKISEKLSLYGLNNSWEMQQVNKEISVTCTISHVWGHSKTVTLTADPDDSAGKNSIQSIASTVTYLERYTLLAATGLAAHDQDDDGRGSEINKIETITPEQAVQITDLVDQKNMDINVILRAYRINELIDLPKEYYSIVVEKINKTKQKTQESK